MIKALVVDDEAPARSELRYLLEEAGRVEVVGEASNAQEALQLIKAIPYDVVFLDIDMPGLSGMQLAETLAQLERQPAVVFVTAYSEHAVKAFEVQAADYLVKPVEVGRLRQAVERLVPAEEAPVRIERIPVEKAGKKLLLQVGEIFYIMAKDDYSYIFTSEERYLSTISLAQLEQKLEPQGFFRVHRRFVVNLSQVKEVAPMYGGTMLLTLKDKAATQVPASRRRVPSLKKALGL
ncbi:MAG: response regulator transcription factor [Coriobacteriia bacterium]|nr:response regulator transcription factor [Coriobacteriia bacterium]MBN2822896.1 response regulator transcription factor [Coriobacteriia bacterium]